MVFRVRQKGDQTDDDFSSSRQDRSDMCRLQIVKNRLEGKGSLFLKMAGQDRFERGGWERRRRWRSERSPGCGCDLC